MANVSHENDNLPAGYTDQNLAPLHFCKFAAQLWLLVYAKQTQRLKSRSTVNHVQDQFLKSFVKIEERWNGTSPYLCYQRQFTEEKIDVKERPGQRSAIARKI